MNLESLGWKVTRTYDDFSWLQTCLKSRFLANYIVEVPEIGATEETKGSDLALLSYYINHVVNSPDLLYSPELVEFLKLDEKEFSKAKGVIILDQEAIESALQEAQRHFGFQP